MNFDTEKFEALIEAKRFDEAKALLKQTLSQDLTSAQEGALYTQLAMAQLQLNNAMNRRYKAVLENVVEGLNGLKKIESGLDDKINLASVRGKLAK